MYFDSISHVVDKMTQRLQELLDKEKSYINDLKAAIEVYENYGLMSLTDPSMLQMPEDLKHGTFRYLFANISELHEFHVAKVLPNIERSVEAPILLYTLFTAWKREFCNLYGRYSASRSKMSDIFVANASYFEQVKQVTNCQSTLDRLFLAPLHAIPRYKLLIKDAEKEFNKGKDEDNAGMMEKVLTELHDICEYCNEMVDVGYIINFQVNILQDQNNF